MSTSTDIFATRPMAEKTTQYCVNDVIHLPALHNLYLGRLSGDWLTKVQKESIARVTTALSAEYDPQSPTKKLGPWTSESNGSQQSMYDWLEDRQYEMFEDNEVGYYDDDPWDDSGCNAADGAFDEEAFDSCWDKN